MIAKLFLPCALLVGAICSNGQTLANSKAVSIGPVSVAKLIAQCKMLEEMSAKISTTRITLQDSTGRPLAIQIDGHDIVFEYGQSSQKAPIAMTMLGRRIEIPSINPELLESSRDKMTAKLLAYKQIRKTCGLPELPRTVGANPGEGSGDQMIAVPGGGGGWYGDGTDDYYYDPVFWSDAWEPDYYDSANYAVDSWLTAATTLPQPCIEKCNQVVDAASDTINLACAWLGYRVHPLVGLSCAAGSHVGKYAGKLVCEVRCPH